MTSLNAKISDCSNSTDIDSCLSEFVGIIDDVSSPFFKKYHSKNATESKNKEPAENKNPWYNEECHESKYIFLHMLNKYRSFKTDENRKNMVKARSNYKSIIRKCRLNYDKERTKKFVDAKFKNAKMYWNMLKELAHVKPANIPLSSFEQYFRSINNPLDPFYSPDEDIVFFNERYANDEFNIMFEELNIGISREEILNAIKQLKLNKSSGPDMLINEFFVHGKCILAPTLCILFNKIFDKGHFPEEWSEGYIVPLHKKGSINDVDNYRGITLLSVLGELFTRILNNRLSEWAENYHVLIEAQAGFRPGMSTIDNVFVMHGLLSHILNQGDKLYCAFVDYTKAFDYIVRENLWYKMIKYGLRGNFFKYYYVYVF